ncbi:YvcK family protein [Candidatus Dojkabacteria bacterium]|nr:YvcK family protein [Candidatus Dojkabacteria bacterium]
MNIARKTKINVVVIGGGTGTYTVLSGLKKYSNLTLNAIVGVTDSGGSTGKLRDEFGTLPIGDFRQAIVALSGEGNGKNLLRELFLYRFEKGDGLKGHNFGNLLLTALTEILGSEEKAISAASKILRVQGEVIMVANDNVDLVAEYEDGSVLVGEAHIDEPDSKHDSTTRITSLRIQPNTKVSNKARCAILNADYIIMGPGDLYSSLLSNIVVPGVSEAINESKAEFVYITNLMTKCGQTYGFTIKDHVSEIIKYLGKYPDYILVNSTKLPEDVLDVYVDEKAFPVKDDLSVSGIRSKIIRKDLLSSYLVERQENDRVRRSLIRHDSHKLAKAIYEIMNSK